MPGRDGTGPRNCAGLGLGRGMGRGFGRGMGLGRGYGLGFRQQGYNNTNINPTDELTFLKNNAKELEEELKQVQQRIENMEKK